MLALISLLSQEALAQLGENTKSKPPGFVLERVCIARSSPARSRQLILREGRGAYLARRDAVNGGGVWVPPQPACAHDVLREGEKSC